MTLCRLALANLPHPATAEESVASAVEAVAQAGRQGAELICFPECFVPGYRGLGHTPPPPDAVFLERGWDAIAAAARQARVAVVLGTERLDHGVPVATALVIDRDGERLGFQDKVQIDPSEEGTYQLGAGRRLFRVGALTFGVVICHEGWRYPETVRLAVRHGAQVVFHPHYHPAGPPSFHAGAALCRAAENTCWFVTVNFATAGSPTTSAIGRPDGTLLCQQDAGVAGLLVATIDLDEATGLLASRLRLLERQAD